MNLFEMYGKKDIVMYISEMFYDSPVINTDLCTVWSDGINAIMLYLNPEIPVLRELETEGYYYSYIWKLEYHNHGEKVYEKNIGMEVLYGRLVVYLSDLREFANSCRLATDILDKFSTNKPLDWRKNNECKRIY